MLAVQAFFLLSERKYLLIFRYKCFSIYIKVGESGAKGWKVDKVDNFVDNFCITCGKPLNIVLIKFFLFIKNHIYQRFKMLIKLYTLFFH